MCLCGGIDYGRGRDFFCLLHHGETCSLSEILLTKNKVENICRRNEKISFGGEIFSKGVEKKTNWEEKNTCSEKRDKRGIRINTTCIADEFGNVAVVQILRVWYLKVLKGERIGIG